MIINKILMYAIDNFNVNFLVVESLK